MWSRKLLRARRLAFLLTFMTACSDGLLGGDITAQFAGINKALVMGPTSVSIDWKLDPKCSSYEIYALTASTTSQLRTASVPPVILNEQEDHILSETAYSFAVGCNRDGILTGLDVNSSISTWREFDGVISNPESLVGGAFRFTWNYPDNAGTKYLVYAIEALIPGAPTQLSRKDAGNFRIGYQDEPICTTFNNRITIGPGGECNPGSAKLKPGSLYQFHVVAQYPDNNFSNNLAINAKSKLIDSSFEAPNCTLTQLGMGPEATSTSLYLRCSDNGAANECGFNNISVRAYQGVSNSRNPVSGEITLNSSQSNILQIQAQAGVDPTNERKVKNLEIEYTCKKPGQAVQKMVVRYDGTNNFREPDMKYGNSGPIRGYETAPEQSYLVDPREANPVTQSPSRMGGSIAVGDFDCDGNPDLAAGLPFVTYNHAPYFNRNSESGAVKIYYNYSMTAGGTITAANGVQYLSFGDLGEQAHFGETLSAGNINKDVAKSVTNNFESYYSCDDLIIGAPAVTGNNVPGRAFVFYGQRQRFPNYPVNAADLPKNSATCSSSSLEGQNCTPVELIISDFSDRFRINTITHNRNNGSGDFGLKSQFGFKVAYVRDFNADGFGDIVVTDPNCMYDGYVRYDQPFTNSGANAMAEVGCFYLYFGGKEGIQALDVGVPVNALLDSFYTNATITSPYIKVYPPFIQSGMHFGRSISGGADVDGRLPVPVPVSNSKIILANGYDFVVGAPDFKYSTSLSNEGGTLPGLNNLTYLENNVEDPYVTWSTAINLIAQKITPPLNGAWSGSMWGAGNAPTGSGTTGATPTGLLGSTGIAFNYLGRHSLQDYTLKMTAAGYFFPEGNGSGTVALYNGAPFKSLLNLFSWNSRDRQGHTAKLELIESGTAALNKIRPTRSFYNCGVRGAPNAPEDIPAQGGLKIHHYSCLAGRNNFTTLFPTILDTDTSIAGFGASLGMAGTQDSNLIAQFFLRDFLGASSFTESQVVNATSQLLYNSQGKVHERIRGYSLWEAGIKDFSAETGVSGDLGKDNMASSDILTGDVTGLKVRRTALNEAITMTGAQAPAGGSRPQMDLNRDGYGDILVGSSLNSSNTSSLSIFYGNFAADFSYSYAAYKAGGGSPSTTNSSCLASRAASVSTSGPATNNAQLTSAASPFSTFNAQVKTKVNTSEIVVSAEFPNLRLPASPGGMVYFVDGRSTSTPGARLDNTTGLSCKPQVRYLSGYRATSIDSADVNGDGTSDFILGFPDSNGTQGSVSVLSGSAFNGVGAEGMINTSSSQALFGSAVSAVSWKYLLGTTERPNHEQIRRDVWVGARGRNRGEGAVFAHSSWSDIQSDVPLNTSVAGAENPLTDASNSPNNLYAEISRIVGDINGDGFDDILVPVKRMDSNGSPYLDAILYFGSSMGPVTNTFCRTHVSNMKTQPTNGQSISPSECLGSTSGSISAYLNGSLIRLPQYVERPTGVGAFWIRHAFRAGDVNKDGRDDLVLFDPSSGGVAYLYLFFGSESGLVNGEPLWGASSNRNPQKVTENVHLPYSDYELDTNEDVQDLYSKAVALGDFNGDGFGDFAIGQPAATSPSLHSNSKDADGRWNCTGTQYNGLLNYLGTCTGNATDNAGGRWQTGQVLVFYGGTAGFQIPSRLSTPIDARASVVCENYLQNCSTSTNFREVYGSLYFNSASSSYQLRKSSDPVTMGATDQGSATCDPDSGLNGAARDCGAKATVIRYPLFYNFAGSVEGLEGVRFGSSLTAGDFNDDGVLDLAVGSPRHQQYQWNSSDWSADAGTLYGTNPGGNADTLRRGAVYIYYGSKGGIVAPKALDYFGDKGMGIGGADLKGIDSRAVLVLSPEPWVNGLGVTQPALDGPGASRRFGTNLTVGDFNGDRKADLAVTSRLGQLYIYYGPICNTDNARSVVRSMYNNPGLSSPSFGEANSPITVTPGFCKSFKLLNFADRLNIGVESLTKRNGPQTITLPAVSANTNFQFGSVLVSAMPKKEFGQVYAGNINGDPGLQAGDAVNGASDLIIGGGGITGQNGTIAHDSKIPRVGGRRSGLGFVLFGHATGGAMNSNPGLFVGAPADYNSTIFSSTTGGVTRLHYTPLALRPYEPDGTVGSFFRHHVSLGDLNGDGTGDLLLPTNDLDRAGYQSAPVISGGGFKLIY